MSVTVKRGATVRITMELTETEWAAIYPWDSIKAEAQLGDTGRPGWVEHELTLTADPDARVLLLTAATASWAYGKYRWDVRAEKGGESIFLPPDSAGEIVIIEGITE